MAYYAVQNVVSVFDGTLVRQKDYSCKIEGEKTTTWFAYRNPNGKSIYTSFTGGKLTLGKLCKSGNIFGWHFNKFIGQAS